jgi:hypothetical protein
MQLWASVAAGVALVALLVLFMLGATNGRRRVPPPQRSATLTVDWTKQWRKALDSLDAPPPRGRIARLRRRPAARAPRSWPG